MATKGWFALIIAFCSAMTAENSKFLRRISPRGQRRFSIAKRERTLLDHFNRIEIASASFLSNINPTKGAARDRFEDLEYGECFTHFQF